MESPCSTKNVNRMKAGGRRGTCDTTESADCSDASCSCRTSTPPTSTALPRALPPCYCVARSGVT
jgi:hypothetical protein